MYSGSKKLTDPVAGVPLDVGKLVLSPTRTYAPIVKKILDVLRPHVHGLMHCSGGAQARPPSPRAPSPAPRRLPIRRRTAPGLPEGAPCAPSTNICSSPSELPERFA